MGVPGDVLFPEEINGSSSLSGEDYVYSLIFLCKCLILSHAPLLLGSQSNLFSQPGDWAPLHLLDKFSPS